MEGHLRLLLLLALLAGAGVARAEAEVASIFSGAAYAEEKTAVLVAREASTCSANFSGRATRAEAEEASTTRGIMQVPAVLSIPGVDPNPAVVASMATAVALFCRRGLPPAAACCEPIVSYVDLAGICRVTNQPQLILARLNSSRLLRLYTICGGQRAVLAASCQGTSPPGVPIITPSPSSFKLSTGALPPAVNLMLPLSGSKLSTGTGDTTTCDAVSLGRDLTENCNVDKSVPARSCCTAVLMAIDDADEDCLCNVIEDAGFVLSRLDISFMWQTYTRCGGKNQAVPKDVTRCDHAPSPPPSPSPPASPPPPPPHRGLPALAIAGIVLGTILVISATVAGAVVLYHKLKTAEVIVVPEAPGILPAILPHEPIRESVVISLPGELVPEDVEEERAPLKPSVREELELVPRPPPTGPPPPLPQVIIPPPPPVLVPVQ